MIQESAICRPCSGLWLLPILRITLEKLRVLLYDVSRVLQETVLNASFLPDKKTSKLGSTTAANYKALS